MSGHLWLAERARQAPSAPCLLGLETGDWATVWARLEVARARYAPDRGRVVAFSLEDGPEAAIELVGCLMSGAIAFPLPKQATAHEQERLLAGLDVARRIESLELPKPAGAPGSYPEDRDVALLVATSGSTGTPKRVAQTYGGLWWNARTHAESLNLDAATRTLIVSPLYHAFPFVALLLGTLAVGGAVDFLGAFTPKSLLRRVATSDINYVALSPTALRLLIERDKGEMPLPAVLSVGAGPMPAAELAAAGRWAAGRGSQLYHTYGLSEAGPRVATLAPADLLAGHEASVGRPFSGVEVRIMPDGEVWLRSPSVMAGYYPEGGGLAEDGWLPTGDRGRLDAEGFLILEGRLKDVIVTGGVTVSAREVEEALLADARVVEAAVVGMPDPVYGEVGRAFVVTRTPTTGPELMTHLTGLLSRHKLPHRIELVSALPRTALGKVDKGRLKEAACEA